MPICDSNGVSADCAEDKPFSLCTSKHKGLCTKCNKRFTHFGPLQQANDHKWFDTSLAYEVVPNITKKALGTNSGTGEEGK